jgi:hypothetical protein
LNNLGTLDNFCNFLSDIYTKKNRYNYDKLVSHYAVRTKNKLPGGACDMTAFDLYHHDHPGEIGELTYIIYGSVYYPAINTPAPGFKMKKGVKEIIYRNGVPYGYHLNTGRLIKFNTLHFQSNMKAEMARYYSNSIKSYRNFM